MNHIKLGALISVNPIIPWVFESITEIESYNPIVTVTKVKPLITYEDYIVLLEKNIIEHEYVNALDKYHDYLDYAVDHIEPDIQYYKGYDLTSLKIYLKEKL